MTLIDPHTPGKDPVRPRLATASELVARLRELLEAMGGDRRPRPTLTLLQGGAPKVRGEARLRKRAHAERAGLRLV